MSYQVTCAQTDIENACPVTLFICSRSDAQFDIDALCRPRQEQHRHLRYRLGRLHGRDLIILPSLFHYRWCCPARASKRVKRSTEIMIRKGLHKWQGTHFKTPKRRVHLSLSNRIWTNSFRARKSKNPSGAVEWQPLAMLAMRPQDATWLCWTGQTPPIYIKDNNGKTTVV